MEKKVKKKKKDIKDKKRENISRVLYNEIDIK